MSRVRMCIDVPAMRQVWARAGVASLALAVALMVSWGFPGRSSAAPLPRIDMKVLLVGTSATEPDFVAWQAALQREGVQFDTVVGASHTPITAATLSDTLPDGTREGKYQAVIMAVSGDTDCSGTTCVSDLSAAESSAIESYEQEFEVRQITGDAFPSATNGLNSPTTTGALDGVDGSLTPDGQKVFPSLKGSVPMDTGSFGYEATPISTRTSTRWSPDRATPRWWVSTHTPTACRRWSRPSTRTSTSCSPSSCATAPSLGRRAGSTSVTSATICDTEHRRQLPRRRQLEHRRQRDDTGAFDGLHRSRCTPRRARRCG